MTAQKMVNLDVIETSGVDHPAHLHEGWVIMKQADKDSVADTIAMLRNYASPTDKETETVDSEQIEDTTVEEPNEAVSEEVVEVEAEAEVVNASVDEIAEEPEIAADDPEDLLKAAPEAVREMLEKARAEADEVRAELQKAKDAEADRQYVEKAAGWTHLSIDAAKMGPMLRVLAGIDEELEKMVSDALASANGQAESGAIFDEIGKSTASAETADAWSQISARANELMSSGIASNFSKAVAMVAEADKTLYSTYLTEKGL